uniref:BPTI/Kunitz inhibitor domain-containing protein n=1 Tax=Amblyomma cajennense TaxID=34607 RepID=A0A023FFJ4_AMBCJ
MNFYTASLFLASAITVLGESIEKPQCINSTNPNDKKMSKFWICEKNSTATTCRRRDYYYDPRSQMCNFLGFMGCNGTKNNFPSLYECAAHCRMAATLSPYAVKRFNKIVPNCTMKPIQRPEKGGIRRFVYNSTSDRCHPVLVKNGDDYFPDINSCAKFCQPEKPKELKRCRVEKTVGEAPQGWDCTVDTGAQYTICVKKAADDACK